MSIVRIKHNENNPHTVVGKVIGENPNLSYGARGMMLYLLGKPEGYEIRMSDLERSAPDGRQRVRSILQELERAGHVTRRRFRGDDGRFRWETILFEAPHKEAAP